MHRLDPVLVGVGGFVGATLRWGVDVAVPGAPGTFAANVVGACGLGLVVALALPRRVQVVVGTGLLSSFTTYSTFAVESIALGPVWGVVNVGLTYLVGVAAAVAGLAAGRRLRARRGGGQRERVDGGGAP